jgi:excisionase family DNA binding protein
MSTADERKLTVRETAKALGVIEACIRRWILLRKIACFRIGRLVRIGESEVTRILEEGFVPVREAR